jgi:hypothetical protein
MIPGDCSRLLNNLFLATRLMAADPGSYTAAQHGVRYAHASTLE